MLWSISLYTEGSALWSLARLDSSWVVARHMLCVQWLRLSGATHHSITVLGNWTGVPFSFQWDGTEWKYHHFFYCYCIYKGGTHAFNLRATHCQGSSNLAADVGFCTDNPTANRVSTQILNQFGRYWSGLRIISRLVKDSIRPLQIGS